MSIAEIAQNAAYTSLMFLVASIAMRYLLRDTEVPDGLKLTVLTFLVSGMAGLFVSMIILIWV